MNFCLMYYTDIWSEISNSVPITFTSRMRHIEHPSNGERFCFTHMLKTIVLDCRASDLQCEWYRSEIRAALLLKWFHTHTHTVTQTPTYRVWRRRKTCYLLYLYGQKKKLFHSFCFLLQVLEKLDKLPNFMYVVNYNF